MLRTPYSFDLRRGDTIQAEVAEVLSPVKGLVIGVDDHGWYREFQVRIGSRQTTLRLYRDREHRRLSSVRSCRLLRRRDRRALTIYH